MIRLQMEPSTLVQQLKHLQAILHAIPPFLKSRKQSSPVLGLNDSAEDIDCISGFRNFQGSVSKETEVLRQYLEKPGQGSNFSTNAPYLIAVWNEIISSPFPILAVGKTFPTLFGKCKVNMPNETVKVDVVANEGRTWIRVNTIKNSRLMAEFREFDSYLTRSEDEAEKPSSDSDDVYFPTDQDNSLLRMGRALIRASSVPLIGTDERPKVVLRLTRLDPAKGHDSRIGQVIDDLRQLGLDVQLGERPFKIVTDTDSNEDHPSIIYQPTNRVNLDLSVLIALISDLTHAELPANQEDAKLRFSGLLHTRRDEKQQTSQQTSSIINFPRNDVQHPDDLDPVENIDTNEFTKHSRALFLQCLQEMDRGILNEIVERLSMTWPIETMQFWTTKEARDRAFQIVDKVGGPNEKKRARALFEDTIDDPTKRTLLSQFWKNSRFPCTYFPSLLPIRVHPSGDPYERRPFQSTSLFHLRLAQTCQHILQNAGTPHPRLFRKYGEMERAQVSSLNAKLTMHTVSSILFGIREGMTTLTANKTSVRTLLREMHALQSQDDIYSSNDDVQLLDTAVNDSDATATFLVMWIIEPRSLAENMRLDGCT